MQTDAATKTRKRTTRYLANSEETLTPFMIDDPFPVVSSSLVKRSLAFRLPDCMTKAVSSEPSSVNTIRRFASVCTHPPRHGSQGTLTCAHQHVRLCMLSDNVAILRLLPPAVNYWL